MCLFVEQDEYELVLTAPESSLLELYAAIIKDLERYGVDAFVVVVRLEEGWWCIFLIVKVFEKKKTVPCFPTRQRGPVPLRDWGRSSHPLPVSYILT